MDIFPLWQFLEADAAWNYNLNILYEVRIANVNRLRFDAED